MRPELLIALTLGTFSDRLTLNLRAKMLFQAIKDADTTKVEDLLKLDERLITARRPSEGSCIILNLFHVACQQGNVAIMDLLKEYGVDMFKRTTYGFSSIHLATVARQLGSIEYLLSNGFDINDHSYNKLVPLFLACRQNSNELVEFVLKKGALVNIMCDAETPLHIACRNNNKVIVKALLNPKNNGAGNLINVFGNCALTPMHIACANGNLEIINELLAHGGDIFQKSKVGKTALAMFCLRNGLKNNADYDVIGQSPE